MTDEKGFTLLEVIVALVILAAGATSFFETLRLALPAASTAVEEDAAAEIASGLLAELGRSRDLRTSATEGYTSRGQHWRLTIQLVDQSDMQQTRGPLDAYVVTLQFDWRETRRLRHLTFKTLLLRNTS